MHLVFMQQPGQHVAGPYSVHRLFEWYAAVTMLLVAVTLAMPGDTFDRGALRPFAEAGFTESVMSCAFALIGGARAMALWANGNLNSGKLTPQGALIRAWCCVAGAMIWGQMTLTLFVDAMRAAAPSFVLPMFGAMTMFELLSAYRARLDATERRDPVGKALDRLTASL